MAATSSQSVQQVPETTFELKTLGFKAAPLCRQCNLIGISLPVLPGLLPQIVAATEACKCDGEEKILSDPFVAFFFFFAAGSLAINVRVNEALKMPMKRKLQQHKLQLQLTCNLAATSAE